jgi:hypothetical protein
MKNLSDGLPIIIDDTASFSYYLGLFKGTFNLVVYDNGTDQFPCVGTLKSNKGEGSCSEILKGNEVIIKELGKARATITISDWKCTKTELSFHIKVDLSASGHNFTIYNRDLKGSRHNQALIEEEIAELLKKLELAKAK